MKSPVSDAQGAADLDRESEVRVEERPSDLELALCALSYGKWSSNGETWISFLGVVGAGVGLN